MQVIRGEYPPNFEMIAEAIPTARRPGVIFAYGDYIYAPTPGGEITDHLMKHEAVHGERQNKIGVDRWWALYVLDIKFRYHEELLAHRAEYLSMIDDQPNRNQRRASLKFVAKRLASSLYGCGVTGWKKTAKDILNE